jgi:tRNA (pseudouridine54-N1)-methyltransferase
MRGFVLFSNHGRTSGKFKDLVKAGRLDIVVHSIIHAFFVSNAMRGNVHFHAILNGPPDPPKHIHFLSHKETPYSKKDIGTLLQITLWKYKPGRKVEAFPGIFIEKKSFEEVLEVLRDEAHPLYLLDPAGKPIDTVEIEENPVFVLGDHLGIPKKERRFARKVSEEVISLSQVPYFTSQCIASLHFHLDKLGKEIMIWKT